MIEIQPVRKPVQATVKVPGSKSYTNRALLVAALAEGKSHLSGVLFSDDTERMLDSLQKLGLQIEIDRDNCTVQIVGNGGQIPVETADLNIGNAGTVARPLVSYAALGHGTYRFDGAAPMRKSRPMADLLIALRQLGVTVKSEMGNDRFPLMVVANGLTGGSVRLNASKSSQFLTSLLMVAPVTEQGMEIELEGALISQPYIDITLSVMNTFGASVTNHDYRLFTVPGGQTYQAQHYTIEPDASNASYFFALAAITGGCLRIDNLNRNSAQGDVKFVEVLEKMGCRVNYLDNGIEVSGNGTLNGVEVDMNAISDTSLTLTAIAPFATSPTTIRNIEHCRWQETDRITAMVTELRRLGIEVEEFQDGLRIQPATEIQPAEIETYDDHRMAMSFTLVGLKRAGIKIKNPACVNKTFPCYFQVLSQLVEG